MKIGIVGTRGIPAKYGGFETFAQEVSPLLVKKGFQITVYCDKSMQENPDKEFNGVKLRYQHTTKTTHSLLFYFDGILMALKENDIILVTGTGGSFFYFLNLFFRKKIITNTDGVESRRAKWSKLKKALIKLSEKLAIKYSDFLIADSKGIEKYLLDHYPRLKQNKLTVIEYGAYINTEVNQNYINSLRLKNDDFYLVVSRLEPENNLHIILDGYDQSHTQKLLIIVGNILENEYVSNLLKFKSSKIRFIGGVYNQKELTSLRNASFAYIHGHSVGGTNPSLLEALGSSNICICHDNIFNNEVTDNKQLYFKNAFELKNRIKELEEFNEESLLKLKKDAKFRIENYYTWQNIADKYSKLFTKL